MGDQKRREKARAAGFGKAGFGKLPPDVTDQQFAQILEEDWELLGAFAFESYLTHDRGIVLFDWDLSLGMCEHLPEGTLGAKHGRFNFPMFYIGKTSPYPDTLKNLLLDLGLKQLIHRYDPSTMVVIGLAWGFGDGKKGDFAFKVFGLIGGKTPAQAYIENGERLREFEFNNPQQQIMVKPQPIRRVEVAVRTDLELVGKINHEGRKHIQYPEKGAVLAVARGNEILLQYMPIETLINVLTDGEENNGTRSIQYLISQCNFDNQIVLVISDDVTGIFYPYLIGFCPCKL